MNIREPESKGRGRAPEGGGDGGFEGHCGNDAEWIVNIYFHLECSGLQQAYVALLWLSRCGLLLRSV